MEKDKVWVGKLKHTGIVNFRDFYAFCYKWLTDQDYFIVEKNYNEKITGTGKEVEIQWVTFRKISDYFKFEIKLDWKVITTPVEVEKNGKRIKADQVYLEIKIEAIIQKDYESRWESHAFYKFLRGLYDRYVIRSRIEDYEIKLYGEVEELRNQMKSFLVLSGKT